MDCLFFITCSLENNAFSVLHYVMSDALHYSMLHRFEIFSAPGTIAHGLIRLPPRSLASSRGCSLPINEFKTKENKTYLPRIKFNHKIYLKAFAKTTPGASPRFTNVKRRVLVPGHPVNKNLGMPDEMVMDGKGTLRASYLSQSDCRIRNIMQHCSWIPLIKYTVEALISEHPQNSKKGVHNWSWLQSLYELRKTGFCESGHK